MISSITPSWTRVYPYESGQLNVNSGLFICFTNGSLSNRLSCIDASARQAPYLKIFPFGKQYFTSVYDDYIDSQCWHTVSHLLLF